MNQFIELKDEIFSHPKESWQLEYKKITDFSFQRYLEYIQRICKY